MVRRRSFMPRRVLVPVALMLAAFVSLPAPVAGLSYSASASVISSGCKGPYSWRGDVPNDNAYYAGDYQSMGTGRACTWFFKISDSDPAGDYYAVATSVTWTTTQLAYLAMGDNRGTIRLASSIGGINGIYEGNPDHTETVSGSCTDIPISAGASGYGFSVGITITPRLCDGGRLSRDAFSSYGATWSSPDVSRTPRWEVDFLVKVGQGKKPKLTVTWNRPCYNAYRDSTTLYWKYTRVYCSVTHAYQVL